MTLQFAISMVVIVQGTQQAVCADVTRRGPTNPLEDINEKLRLDGPRVFPFECFPKVAAVENSFVTQRQVE
jgi:hypothetical protein